MKGTPNQLSSCKEGDACNWCGQPISATDAAKSAAGFPYHESCRRPFKPKR